MKRYSAVQKYIAVVCSCAFIFIFASQHADAARRSRVLSIALFASGMGFQLGGSLLKSAAQDHYDTYLNAAIQADIQTHKNAFLVRQNASTIMSRVGLGCVGLAVLFSIYNQLDTPELVEDSVFSTHNLQTDGEMPLSSIRNFTDHLSKNMGLLFLRPGFQLHPHYDFRTQRASLRLAHYF